MPKATLPQVIPERWRALVDRPAMEATNKLADGAFPATEAYRALVAREIRPRVPEATDSALDEAIGALMCEYQDTGVLIGWALHATADPFDDESDWGAWVARALAFAGLPTKAEEPAGSPVLDQLGAWLTEKCPGVTVDEALEAVPALARLKEGA